MKGNKLIWLMWFAGVLSAQRSPAQGAFQNLDFEAANVTGYAPGDYIPVSAALPGWSPFYSSGLYGTQYVSQVVYDVVSIGGPVVSLYDTNFSVNYVPQGRYSAVLYAGGSVPLYSAGISQTGLIPAGTRSLQFDTWWVHEAITLSVNGQALNWFPLNSHPNYTVYGADISQFAGQVVELAFTEPPPAPGLQPSWAVLDGIRFSESVIPEPSTLVLAGFGFAALVAVWLRRRR